MKVTFNSDTGTFDLVGMSLEQISELAQEIEDTSMIIQLMPGDRDEKEIYVQFLETMYTPIVSAMLALPDEERGNLPKCNCPTCIVKSLREIKNAAPFN